MKPLNLDNRPCSPISSNCVIWQGPDIPCINLCSGDTVSDVVFKLATELCIIMDQLNVSNYDLSCLELNACPPKDFQVLIQLLITKICEANGVVVDTTKASGCPDCVVSVAICFVEGTQTTMQLVDYVQMIANRVCSILSQIEAINNELVIINDTLVDLQYQIDNIPVYTLPNIPADCILPAGTYPLDQVLDALMNDDILGYCSLLTATGTPAQIVSAVLSQCILDGDPSLASLAAGDSPVQSFSTYYAGSWVNNPSLTTTSTIANAIKNIWISICDIYSYVTSLGFIVADTNTVNLTYSAGLLTAAVQDTGWVRLNGFSFMLDNNLQGVPMVRRIGNVLHFRGTVIVPLISGGGALTWNYLAGVDSYFLETTVLPFSGAGGVTIGASGNVTFNNGNSVIPLSVLPLGYAIDKNYQNPAGWKLAHRAIPIDGDNSTLLTTFFSQVITTTGALALGMVKDLESSTISGAGGAGSWDTSPFNNMISHVRSGEFVPDYNSSTSTIHSSPNNGSTDTVTLPAPLAPDTQYLNNLSQFYTTGYTYPFSCNANDQNQIGGFFQRLDGLTAFISPCGDLIPTPTPC